MTTQFPVVSLNVMKQLFPEHPVEANEIASNGLWFYSVPDAQFLSYIPNINICVNDIEPVFRNLNLEDVNFRMRKYGSIFEVTMNDSFPSSFLLAKNIHELISNHLDVTDDLHVAILNSITAPIMIGSKKALARLLLASEEDSYKMLSLKIILERRN